MLIVLTSITVIIGALLGYVNQITEGPIKLAEKAKQEKAIKKVAPHYNNDPIAEKYERVLNAGTKDSLTITIFPAKENGKPIGAAVETQTNNGFSGNIKVMVGFDNDGKIINYMVLNHSETPGLGSKMEKWFKDENGNRSIIGKNAKGLKVKKDGGNIDAITAATISSRAFLDAIENGYNAFMNKTDAQSGASPKWNENKEGGKNE